MPATGPTIVVGYDGSPAARVAIEYACARAGETGRVVVVHACESPADWVGTPNMPEILEERRKHGRALLDGILLDGNDALADVDYETELISAAPAPALLEAARSHGADEIVVGTRGFGRVRALLGSSSHELLHIADRPVVVLPAAMVEQHAAARAAAAQG